jgi:flagellar hook-associated protein 2
MATITATTGSIDVNGIVTSLMQIERQPLTKIAQSRSTLQTKLSSVGQVSAALTSFQDAARTLLNSSTWKITAASSSDATAVAVTSGDGAPVGSYGIAVSQLAQRQSGATAAFASVTSAVGGGTLQLQFGRSDTGGFAADSNRPATTIAIAAGATVSDVVSAINTANAGVTASTVKDGSGVRILLRGRDSGADNAFKLTATPDAGSDLATLNFDPSDAGSQVALNQSALDARYKLDGLELTSSTNKIEGALDGVTLELRTVTTSPVAISVGSDSAAIRTSVDKFVSAYNALNKNLSDATKYDAATKTAGTLQGDTTFVTLQARVRQILAQTFSGGDLQRLSDLGISIQRDGSLSVDSTKFNAAAVNPDRLQTLFANSDSTNPAKVGFARRFNDLITGVLGIDGTISGSQDRIHRQMTSLDSREARINQRLVQVEKRLTQTYTALDVNISKIKSNSGTFGSGNQ